MIYAAIALAEKAIPETPAQKKRDFYNKLLNAQNDPAIPDDRLTKEHQERRREPDRGVLQKRVNPKRFSDERFKLRQCAQTHYDRNDFPI